MPMLVTYDLFYWGDTLFMKMDWEREKQREEGQDQVVTQGAHTSK